MSKEPAIEGVGCLASTYDGWHEATMLHANEDGTYKIKYDADNSIVMPFWYGVTPSEISFNDEMLWRESASRVMNINTGLSYDDLSTLIQRLGYAPSDQLKEFWADGCHKLFGIAAENAPVARLDVSQAYQILRRLNFSAKQIAGALQTAPQSVSFYKLYWNQTRMGGRDPADVRREITLEDAFLALGVKGDQANEQGVQVLDAWQKKEGIILPGPLAQLLTRLGIFDAVLASHPNSPELIEIKDGEFVLQANMRERGLAGNFAIPLMLPHQGDHAWFAVFDEGDKDAKVYLGPGSEDAEYQGWLLTAPTIAFFFWDLAQTGLEWYQDTKYKGGKDTIKTDVGLALKM